MEFYPAVMLMMLLAGCLWLYALCLRHIRSRSPLLTLGLLASISGSVGSFALLVYAFAHGGFVETL